MSLICHRAGWTDQGTVPLYLIQATDSEGKRVEFAGRKPEEAEELFDKARDYEMQQQAAAQPA